MQIDQDETQIHVKEKPTYLTSCPSFIFKAPPHYLHFKLDWVLILD